MINNNGSSPPKIGDDIELPDPINANVFTSIPPNPLNRLYYVVYI